MNLKVNEIFIRCKVKVLNRGTIGFIRFRDNRPAAFAMDFSLGRTMTAEEILDEISSFVAIASFGREANSCLQLTNEIVSFFKKKDTGNPLKPMGPTRYRQESITLLAVPNRISKNTRTYSRSKRIAFPHASRRSFTRYFTVAKSRKIFTKPHFQWKCSRLRKCSLLR